MHNWYHSWYRSCNIARISKKLSIRKHRKGQFWRKPRPHGKTLGLLWLSLDQDGLRPVDEDILESQAVGVGCVHVKPTLINSPPVYEKMFFFFNRILG